MRKWTDALILVLSQHTDKESYGLMHGAVSKWVYTDHPRYGQRTKGHAKRKLEGPSRLLAAGALGPSRVDLWRAVEFITGYWLFQGQKVGDPT